MQMKPVSSSIIHSIGHNGIKCHIQFHDGAIYEFKDVPVKEFEAMAKAGSVGGHFNAHIRNKPFSVVRKASR